METGLGWGANAEWLANTAQTAIGTLSSSSGGAVGCPEVYDGFYIGYSVSINFVITQVSGTAPVYCGSYVITAISAWTPVLFSAEPFTFSQTGGNGIEDWGLVNGWYVKVILGIAGDHHENVPIYITNSGTDIEINTIEYLVNYQWQPCPEAYNGMVIGKGGGTNIIVNNLSGSDTIYCGSFQVREQSWTPLLFSRAEFTFSQTGGNGIGNWGLVNGWYAKEIYGHGDANPSNVPIYNQAGSTDLRPHAINYLTNLGSGLPSSIDFKKSTDGYSVVCMCKWITSYGGDVYCSPVLISSQPNNTLYTRDGSSPSVNNTEHQYQGMTFYMRKAPLDTLDGTTTLASDYPIVDLSGVAQTNDTIFAAVAYQSGLYVGYEPGDEDPYSPGGTSGPSSGAPDFTEVSESISPGSTFPISFQSTGLCRVYAPSLTDLNDLANYLWTDQTFLDTIKNTLINQFENFMEAVISLTMVPCQVPVGTAQPVKVMFLPTGLSFPPATQQFIEIDCGYVDITERYASALDYNPYTKVSLYLPFIGTVPLDTDEVMGHRVKCVYTIDIVSGACVAKILVDYPDSSNGVLYQFSGHCSISMPLTAADFSSYYAAAMSGLKMAAGLAAAGAGAPGLAGALLGEPTAHPSSTTTTTRTTARNAATGRQILTGTESKETSHTPGQASFKELATRASVNTVGAVINSKFSVEHSGGFTGNTGFLGVQAPYVIITRPDMCNPDEYGAYNGRPSMMYLYLGNLSGFTQVQNIKLTGIPATNPELGEIAELLKTGVIL